MNFLAPLLPTLIFQESLTLMKFKVNFVQLLNVFDDFDKRKNPLKNLGVRVRLNPYTLTHRRA